MITMTKPALNLNSGALKGYRNLLLNKKAELEVALKINFHELTEAGEESRSYDQGVLQEESPSVLLNVFLYGQLREVEQALDRLDRGEYGCCLECEEPIAAKRLRAVPWTRYCLSCQEKAGPLYPTN